MDLVFSDIHADIDGLNTILDTAFSAEFENKYGKVSRIINLGDLLERGTAPKDVLSKMNELSKSFPLISVLGNHDEGFLYKRYLSGSSFASQKAHDLLTEEDLEFFKQNKDGTYGSQFEVDHKNKLLVVHGGPLDPEKITKNGEDHWLYQRTWQRLSEEDNEFYSYYGYHYKPASAFREGKTYFDDFVILCGHQHIEAAIKQDKEEITNIWSFHSKMEKIGNHTLSTREFLIEPKNNYIFRVGLGGPQGDHKGREANAHFGLIQDNPKKMVLFRIE
ncbi:MAG TPA: metallophosphoesterase family protein [Candidatus Nitrosotenuis sp.]|nr:metallophosphoesterase family protein [Candidatus Nitrosotenuis sp.]